MARDTVTIFGGTGFVGRYVVRRLARQGWIIRVAVRDPAEGRFLRPFGDVGQIACVFANVRDDRTVAGAVSGARAVVNLVGLLHEGGRQTFDAVHKEGAARVANLSREAGVESFVQMSAIGADPSSGSDYARTKGLAEAAVRESIEAATMIRPSIVFGAEDGFFNRFAGMARLSPVLPLIGGGQTRFQPVYVDDVAKAVAAALADAECRGRTYELGGPRIYTFRQLMELMLQEIERNRMLVNVSFGIAKLQASLLQWLPNPPLTRDQVELLKSDNVVSEDALTLADLGISPTLLEVILPTYMDRYRVGGRYVDWFRASVS